MPEPVTKPSFDRLREDLDDAAEQVVQRYERMQAEDDDTAPDYYEDDIGAARMLQINIEANLRQAEALEGINESLYWIAEQGRGQ